MNTIDFTPLYRSSIGFDRLASLLDNALRSEHSGAGYPPYNIEVLDEDSYAISLAVAGFERHELEIRVENGVLAVSGRKGDETEPPRYLYQGIATRAFERRFNLADHVEVTGAELRDGLLIVRLKRELPEAMKPRSIPIAGTENDVLEHDGGRAA